MEKKWREENDRIMREYPALTDRYCRRKRSSRRCRWMRLPEPQSDLPPEKRELP